MSIKRISDILDNAVVASRCELLILIAMADWCNEQGQCWPSIPELAKKARCSERQVYRILTKLEKEGKLEKHSGGGRGKTSHYVLKTFVCRMRFGLLNPDSMSVSEIVNPDISITETLTLVSQNPDISDTHIRKNRQEPSKREPSEKQGKQKFVLPSWVPKQDWLDWEEMRKRKGAPLTDRARELNLSKLEQFQSRGHPPSKVLQLAIERGWTGLFEPKENTNGRRVEQSGTSAAVAAGVDKFLRRKNAMGSQDVPGAASPKPGDSGGIHG